MKDLRVLLDEIIPVVKEAGSIILNAKAANINEKSSYVDLVTEYDVAVQKLLIEHLKTIDPEASFLGEEDGQKPDLSAEDIFIIDPIDGTANFVFGYNHSAISIGLRRHGEMVMGIIYAPWGDEMYTAIKGEGAFCNGKPIFAASERTLKESIVDFGTSPYVPELRDRSMRAIGPILRSSMDLRRSGSAALDLCDAASGRCGVFFELKLSPWDYAAGSVLVREAGGCITDAEGGEVDAVTPSSIVAGGHKACAELIEILKKVE